MKTGFVVEKSRSRSGMAALFLVLLMAVAASVPMIFQLTARSHGDTRRHLHMAVQADAVARTGLDETLAWFRRQPVQPVHSNNGATYKNSADEDVLFTYPDEAFMPRGASDTLNESIGLVRQYPLSAESGHWARFEVRRVPNAASTDTSAVRDITDKYMVGTTPEGSSWTGAGLCWSVESHATIFKPLRPVSETVYYDLEADAGREIVARSQAYTEIRRLVPNLPAAAIVVQDAGLFEPQFAYIVGVHLIASAGSAALAFYEPDALGRNFDVFFSSGAAQHDLDGSLSVYGAFGVTASALKGLADFYVRGTDLPTLSAAYPEYGLIFIDGDAVFDAAHPFPLNGIVVVNGNMVRRNIPDVSFTGVLYVTGDAEINGPWHASGVTAVEGRARLMSDYGPLEFWHDPQALTFAVRQTGQYRQDRSTTFVKRASS